MDTRTYPHWNDLGHLPSEAPIEEQSTATEREQLFLELTPLLQRLLKQYAHSPGQKCAMQAALYNQFHKAMDCFDPACGTPLRPYLLRHLAAAAQAMSLSPSSSHFPTFVTAMAGLPEAERQVVHGCYYEHLSLAQISDRYGIPLPTVRMLLHMGIERLHELLKS